MNFLKRALLAVSRCKGKTVIMFVIFAAIANLVLAGLAVQHATENASVLARQKLGGTMTLSYNMQRAMQEARAAAASANSTATQGNNKQRMVRPTAEPITEDMVKTISSQKNILDYNYTVNTRGVADGFEPVVSTDTNANNYQGNQFQGQGGQNQSGTTTVAANVSVTGVSSSELSEAFNSGSIKLTQGRAITREDADKKVALIEKNLSDQDSLKVESKIKVKAQRSTNIEVEYTIVGIYQDNSDTSSQESSMNYNRIFVDYKSALPLKTVTSDTGVVTTGGIDSAVFFLDDPKNMDTAVADIKAMKIDWNKFALDANDQAYQQMMGPIESVASFSMLVVKVVAVAGAIILALILMLFIKERMYETGVLLSMGEGKFKVIAQYVTEVLVIAIIAFSISAFTGRFIAQGVGDMLLNREINVVNTQDTNGQFGGGYGQGGQFRALNQRRYRGGVASDVKAIDTLDIVITKSEVGKMTGAGLIIIILGTILPAATIMRYKPKTILTKAT